MTELAIRDDTAIATAALTDQQLIDLARELAAQPRDDGPLSRWSGRRSPLAHSPGDQTVPDGAENPLWGIVRLLPGEQDFLGRGFEVNGYWIDYARDTMNRAHAAGLSREALCGRYTWSIPSPGDIAWLAKALDGRAVVEIGAGSGYWAWQLTQAGVPVAAYDPHPPGPQNKFNQHRLYHPVMPGDHENAAQHPDRALMLCWPSYGAAFAKQALHHYRGDTVVYIGEGEGGCCADDRFHRILARDFDEAGCSPFHVNWYGIHCCLTVWRRKSA